MAVWTAAMMNDLPDACFLYIEPGGQKDAQGRTMPRSLRHLPYKDASGKVNLPHLRNALARLPQTDLPAEVKTRLMGRARAMLAKLRGNVQKLAESARKPQEGLREAGLVGMPEADSEGVFKDCILIRAGLNATGQNYYTEDFLKEHLGKFDQSLSYLDHPTATEERERPERSLEGLAARTLNARWDPAQQAVVGDIKLLSGTRAAEQARALFADPVVRETAGLSIYWPHQVDCDFMQIEGRTVRVPRKLRGPETAKLNLDFVTLPTAGGRVGKAA